MTEQDLSGILVGEEIEAFSITHNGVEYPFKMKELPWVTITKIMSGCIGYDSRDRKKLTIDKSEFDIQYLEAALIEAPWPKAQTRIYLKKLSQAFGNKLSEHIPNPTDIEDEELKKE